MTNIGHMLEKCYFEKGPEKRSCFHFLCLITRKDDLFFFLLFKSFFVISAFVLCAFILGSQGASHINV